MEQAMLIQDHKQTILNLLQEGKTLLESAGDRERAGILERVWQETEEKSSPAIMFYGLYNAGKSTIINALCQAEVAKVGDVPTTTTIQRISWRGYTLIDTPGIDAHAEHTEIAEKEIRESDVILFVMDNADTFDNAIVYRAIVDILDMGKSLAIVINQKVGDENEAPQTPIPERQSMDRIVRKVAENLETQGRENGTQLVVQRKNFLRIFPVNGNMAYNARNMPEGEKRERYLKISGFSDLKNALDTTIARSRQIYMLQTPLINLRDTLRQAVESYQSASIYGEKQQTAKNREALLASRQRLRDRLLADGLRKIEAVFEQMNAAAAANQPVENPSQKLSEELNALLREAAEQEQMILLSELDLDAMPRYQPDTSATSSNAPGDVDNSDTWLLGSGLALGKAVFAPTTIALPAVGIPIEIIIAMITTIGGIIDRLLKNKHDKDLEAQRAAAESQERLANYYRWRNEMRDQEIKIKADYEKSVNNFLVQAYDSKLAEIDRILAEVGETCVRHTKTLRELEQLQLRVSDEFVALAVG